MDDTPFTGRSLHFIGIGGAGMSGLALVARQLGARVSGSDRADSPFAARLRSAGIEPVIGHDAANLPTGAEVVVSTAIPDDNPELAAARAAGARVLHRGDLLGELSAMKRTIAVSGTHGKTTTASMAAHALREAGRAPAFLIGGELRAGADQRRLGHGGVGRDRGRRVRPLLSQAGARGGGGHQHGARPPRDLPRARRTARGLRRVPRAGDLAGGGCGAGPARRRGHGDLRHRRGRIPGRAARAAPRRLALCR